MGLTSKRCGKCSYFGACEPPRGIVVTKGYTWCSNTLQGCQPNARACTNYSVAQLREKVIVIFKPVFVVARDLDFSAAEHLMRKMQASRFGKSIEFALYGVANSSSWEVHGHHRALRREFVDSPADFIFEVEESAK